MMNIFAEAAKALALPCGWIPKYSPLSLQHGVDVSQASARQTLDGHRHGSIGMPVDAVMFFTWNTRFDNREAEIALQGSGISVPRLSSYAARLWDYWGAISTPNCLSTTP